ncbi:MAG TPA: hypothetical protein PKH69_11440 [Thiobacillaceae bacterium]|nr:hypothetical protein [Thiobacillaceae bacterium]HNU65105.1 hypothetical protein [Thiobacillaceae bacterium]
MTPKKSIAATLLYGTASLALYTLLLSHADLFVQWAQHTRENRILFIIPVLVAFVFSYFHGAFTGHFWESLGLHAARSGSGK